MNIASLELGQLPGVCSASSKTLSAEWAEGGPILKPLGARISSHLRLDSCGISLSSRVFGFRFGGRFHNVTELSINGTVRVAALALSRKSIGTACPRLGRHQHSVRRMECRCISEFSGEVESSFLESGTSSDGVADEPSEGLGPASELLDQEATIDLKLPRRRLLVEFTCDACKTRTQRLVNPEAYKRGTVFVQGTIFSRKITRRIVSIFAGQSFFNHAPEPHTEKLMAPRN